MATNISGLFGDITKTPQQYQQEALQGLIVTPAQMGQQGLYQQLVSQMSNAGANIGMGVGGLLGGKTAEQVRGGQINAAMQEVSQGQYATEWEKLDALAKNLAEKGMNAEAEKAAERSAVLKEREFVSGERTRKAAAEKAAVGQQQALVSAIVKQNPDLPVAAAQSIASDPKAVRDFFNPQVKTTFKTVNGRVVMLNESTGEVLKDIGAAGSSDVAALAGSVGQLASSMAGAQAKKAAEAGGTVVGQNIAKVNSGYKSLDALSDAAEMVDKGIYSGGYGPLQEAAAKFTKGAVGDRDRLVNTEAFRAYIGNVVIPMMSQLGGSDSNEELKKMEKIVAGDTTLEAKAIKQIITSAQKAIRRDMARLEAQQEAVLEGKPLPVRPQNGEGKQGVTSSGISYTVED